MAVTVTAVVPTVGASELLPACLDALRRQRLPRGTTLEIVLVRQGGGAVRSSDPDAGPDAPADREIRLPENLGFAAATNRGIAAARGRYVATVNDDAVVAEGWLEALTRALEAEPGAASAQGVNLQGRPDGPAGRVDGWGLAWDRAFQAVQLGRDREPPAADAPPRRVFGVSATAALYRRDALLAVALPGRAPSGSVPEVFDSRLESYYEDADLARRLRMAGYTALSVPRARVLHAGSATGRRLGARRWRLLYGNRYATAAGLLGRAFWLRLPRMVVRDLADLARAKLRLDGRRVLGIAGGWGRALRLLPGFVHGGPPCTPIFEDPPEDSPDEEGGS
ncbi:MAG: glycosyltransferase [Acidobacteriota bacterium]|jgi:GT2 family glycosyltransferase